MSLTLRDVIYLACNLEWFFFGLYSGIFAMYLQSHTARKGAQTILYALCLLYALSMVIIILDVLTVFFLQNTGMLYRLAIIQATIFGCCDFITQSILIYRCWVVWSYNVRVVIIPSFLAFAFLAIWIAGGSAPLLVLHGRFTTTAWSNILFVVGMTVSMTMNALVTGLIVFRILKVFRAVKATIVDDQSSITSESPFRRVIFILVESGMALFSIQLACLVVIILPVLNYDRAFDAYIIINSIHKMINGITPTIILVRVSMGLSFHDESSMVEASIGYFRSVPDDPNTMLETGGSNVVNDTGIQFNNDSDTIQMVER